jgi:hypothetical protein
MSTTESLYNVIRELETQHHYCANKTKFLDNVLLGIEPMTFQVIDRCRETLMQINQAHHVFMTKLDKHRDAPNMQTQIKNTMDEQLALVARANDALFTIQSWLPAGMGAPRIER